MSTVMLPETDEVVYPESDGLPMADSTLQYEWIVKLVEQLRSLFKGQMVFVAGNLFWYPVQGNNKIVLAPDAMVAFGRPPAVNKQTQRGSYLQWRENNIAPQVCFEVLSESNTPQEMEAKRLWYQKYGVQEYYVVDPFEETIEGWLRKGAYLVAVPEMNEFVSPLLKIRFVTTDGLKVFLPNGREFQNLEQAESWAERERERAEDEKRRADKAEEDARAARMELEKLMSMLREQGLNPDDLLKNAPR